MQAQASAPAQQRKIDPKVAAALDRPVRNPAELRQLFARQDVLEQIRLTLPGHMKPERMTKILVSACLKTPKLMDCSQLSLIEALTKLSEIGLEPGSAFGHVYLIPFDNVVKDENGKPMKRTEVQVMIGYKGLLELMRRSGLVSQVETDIVFEGDKFELAKGFKETRKFIHVPDVKGSRDPSKAFLVYLLAQMKDGSEHFEYMTIADVEKIRQRAPGKNSPAWRENFLQMARKTIIRRAANYLPLSAEMAEAMEIEDDSESAASKAIVNAMVTKPDLGMPIAPGQDIASQMAARPRAEQEPEDAVVETVDPATGEVTEAPPASQEQANAEPEAGTIDHLLWRIGRATQEQLAALTKEAGALPKDEPRRLEVGGAISARRQAVQS